MKNIMTLLLALTLTSCATRFTNFRRFDLHRDNRKALVVIDDLPSWSTLGYIDDQNQLHVIRAQLDVLGELRNLYLSPDRRKIMSSTLSSLAPKRELHVDRRI